MQTLNTQPEERGKPVQTPPAELLTAFVCMFSANVPQIIYNWFMCIKHWLAKQ